MIASNSEGDGLQQAEGTGDDRNSKLLEERLAQLAEGGQELPKVKCWDQFLEEINKLQILEQRRPFQE